LNDLLKLIMHFHVGNLDRTKLENFVGSLRTLNDSFYLVQNAQELEIACDENLKREYLRGWEYSIKGEFIIDENFDILDNSAKLDLDVFKDGTAVLVLSFYWSNKRQPNGKQIYNAYLQLINSVYDGDAKFLNLLYQLRECIERFSVKDSELSKIDQEAQGLPKLGFAYSIVIVNDENLDTKPDLLSLFLSPDYSGLFRAPRHLNPTKYIAEILGELKAHASWETFILHGKVYEKEIVNYDVLNRFLLRTWYSSYLLDRLASTYLRRTDEFDQKSATDLKTQSGHLSEMLSNIKRLRRRYLELKNSLLDFDANMSMRFIELLKYTFIYSNLTSLLNSFDEKLNILVDDYSSRYQMLEEQRTKAINSRLQIIAIAIAIFGTVEAVDIISGFFLPRTIGDPLGILRLTLISIPLLLVLIWLALFRRL